ncbi:hypothetical protein SAMN02745126_05318 [Enhydrobacter aerosaccus]|uniref:Hpr(Ser) kinase/phosphatase n=1 Tax=Enhydrobacter aerosaccus TaxID=225324 RepID=A0A1T4SYK8_9HYPH|nr:hypothetical protein [Enhydrobacter aerosaccus]SKA33333.1 hypothetical protein SAMN02745126_05318 [Enhydrobacter aerosaccus]
MSGKAGSYRTLRLTKGNVAGNAIVTGFRRYRIYGLLVESAFPLSSVPEVRDETEAPAIRLMLGTPDYFDAHRPNGPADPLDWVHHAVLPDGSVYMGAEGVFETVISADGRSAICARLGDVDMRSFEANLVNFVLSAALTLRGEEPLHSTAVSFDGAVVGLLGLSGAGKSTLAAFLISQGADLVTDDMLRVTFGNEGVLAYPGPYRLKLLGDAGHRLLPAAVEHGHFNPLSGKTMVQPRAVPTLPQRPMPLAALFHIGYAGDAAPDDPVPVSVRRLSGLELVKAIISSTMDNRYADPRRLERQLRFAAEMADRVPVYALRYPRSFEAMDQIAHLIREKMQP